MKPHAFLRIPCWVTTYRLSDGSEHSFSSPGSDLASHQQLFQRQVVEQLPEALQLKPTVEHSLEWQPSASAAAPLKA